jgi:hypothetical protein
MIRICGMQHNANWFGWLGEHNVEEWMINVIFLVTFQFLCAMCSWSMMAFDQQVVALI